MAQLKGFFKKITGENISYDALAKQPIVDAEVKLNLFKDVTSTSITALENYIKYMSKSIDLQLSEKFFECKEIFKKYEAKGDFLNPNISHVLGSVFGKLHEIQLEMHNEIIDLTHNIEINVLKPLNDYQRELAIVKENRKELKDAYDKIEQYHTSLQKAKKEVDNAQKSTTQTSRLTMISNSNDINKKMNDLNKLEDKVQRIERELDEANSIANEKYDKYTEGLYKRIADECDLTNFYLDYLKLQKRYHKQALKRLDTLIPSVKESLQTYNKKPVFGCSLGDYITMSNNLNHSNQYMIRNHNMQLNSNNNNNDLQYVSPVIRKLIDGMVRQNVFTEEGIFRVAGSRIKMNCILYAINAGYLEYLDMTNDFDVHCLAGVLKQYIRELPDSLLCNDLYDHWISAINTSPQPNKIDAYKNVIQKLPRPNYENLKYLIKFLSKIVENSEKTKMTSTNMGICFGVSLLSNSSTAAITSSAGLANAVNSGSNIGSSDSSSISSKSIDMSTATNVFDFMLTNHNELFPGDINFNNSNTNSLKHTIYQSTSSSTNGSTYSLNNQINNNTNNNNNSKYTIKSPENETTINHINKHYILNDSSLSEHTPSIAASIPQHVGMHQPISQKISNTPPSNQGQYSNVYRHIKQNSMDNRTLENINNEMSSPISSSTSITKTNQIVQQSLTNQLNQVNESGSTSPKLKNKKQAPAPPPVSQPPQPQSSSTAMANVSVSPSLNNSNTQQQLGNIVINTTPLTSGEPQPAIRSNNNNLKTSNAELSTSSSSSSSPTPSPMITKTSDQLNTSSSLEKPNQPPPNIPNRPPPIVPPPIGFNINALFADNTSTQSAVNQSDSNPPYPLTNNGKCPPVIEKTSTLNGINMSENLTNSILLTSSTLSNVSTSSSSSSSQEISPSSSNSLAKYQQQQQQNQVKPTVPRKPGGMVAAHINKFQNNKNSSNLDELNESASASTSSNSSETPKSTTNEITSL